MNQETNTGWGFIGASTIAGAFMVEAIRAQKGQFIQAVMSSQQARADAFAAEHCLPAAYSSIDALLADPEVKAVYISTTNELHHDQVIAAAAAGKHVLCEKPLSMTAEEAIAMARACCNAGVVMATNHHLRNAATHRTMRELIRQGAIGQPLFARVFHAIDLPLQWHGWRIDSAKAGGGVIMDITVHDIDTLRFTLDSELIDVVGMSQSTPLAKQGLPDGVMAVLRFDNGVVAQIHDAYTVKHAATGIEYYGDAGSIIGRNVMTQRPVGDVVLRNADGEQMVTIEHENLYVRGVAAFCDAMAGRGKPSATAEDGIKSLAGALAIMQACRTGTRQTVASLSLEAHVA